MSTNVWFWIVVVAVVVLVAALVAGLFLARRRKISLAERERPAGPPKGGGYQAGGGIALAPSGEKPAPEAPHPAGERTETDGEPGVGDDAAVPRDAPRRGIVDVRLPDERAARPEPAPEAPEALTEPERPEPVQAVPEPVTPEPAPPELAEIEPAAGRIERLRGRLAKSRSSLGQGLLGLLGAGDLDEDSWQEVEDTLLVADLGAATTTEIVDRLRAELSARGVRTADQARSLLREVLTDALGRDTDRSVRALPHTVDGQQRPAVVLVVGVNGTGKTTTTGKLARVLVAQGRQVLLGAADTFRAAAADQLQTWAERVGAEVVRGKEGADPAAVAFDAVKRGVDTGVDAVLVDTAGRLHTKTGLMDELGKVKRVVEKQAEVDEVLLVLDATTGQNGLAQARVFGEVVDVTGIVLTKLDGTAKGGIVFQVQRELGVPVKLVGLGEGPDHLAPFEPEAFVDALLT
ncbi:fused signal recognition particle receptor [Amycolatopsis arida]|uniref:Signal recognition particle receptor FtsY n=1 Tax=Amycolatopsis arida TaxID=587909 RepID=A0A1I5KEP2_9PSEU|nr:signal recognition particle-docking protein FtsY [Amycolatopsis arida]TDX97013.1 fused signal recognition particle receptor [Amycolatopsis arida]SFO83535.1 fused signal recognition particle receptor [Amycolatopsis arida]